MPELGLQVENIVCALDPGLQGAAATVATILREKGQSVDLVLESKPLKWYFLPSYSRLQISVSITVFLICYCHNHEICSISGYSSVLHE